MPKATRASGARSAQHPAQPQAPTRLQACGRCKWLRRAKLGDRVDDEARPYASHSALRRIAVALPRLPPRQGEGEPRSCTEMFRMARSGEAASRRGLPWGDRDQCCFGPTAQGLCAPLASCPVPQPSNRRGWRRACVCLSTRTTSQPASLRPGGSKKPTHALFRRAASGDPGSTATRCSGNCAAGGAPHGLPGPGMGASSQVVTASSGAGLATRLRRIAMQRTKPCSGPCGRSCPTALVGFSRATNQEGASRWLVSARTTLAPAFP